MIPKQVTYWITPIPWSNRWRVVCSESGIIRQFANKNKATAFVEVARAGRKDVKVIFHEPARDSFERWLKPYRAEL